MLVPRRLSLNTCLTHKVDLYRADDIGCLEISYIFKLHTFMDSRYLIALLSTSAQHFNIPTVAAQIGKHYLSHTHIHTCTFTFPETQQCK